MRDIATPLFDPQDRSNASKISHVIRKAFAGEALQIPTELQAYVTQAPLADLLEFGRVEFDAVVSLTVNAKVSSKTSKWPLVKLEDIAEIQSGGTPDSTNPSYWDGGIYWATLADTKEKYLNSTQRTISEAGLKNSSAKLLPVNTVIFSSRATIGEVTITKVPVATNQGYKNFICDLQKVTPNFLYEVLKSCAGYIAAMAGGMTFKEISKTQIANFKIPLPPLNIQQEIVAECEAVDQAVEVAKARIEQELHRITRSLEDASKSSQKDKLIHIAQRVSDSIDPQQYTGPVNYFGLENIESQTGQKVGSTASTYSAIKSTKTCFKAGDVLYGKLRQFEQGLSRHRRRYLLDGHLCAAFCQCRIGQYFCALFAQQAL